MKEREFKKVVALIPSAWNYKALGDIVNFTTHYKDDFKVVLISNLYEEDEVFKDGIYYIKAKTSLSDYYVFTADLIIDAGTVNRHSRVWENQKRVSVWHGIPYKNMFIDLSEKHVYSALNYSSTYDLMVSPSQFYSNKFLRESMLYDGKILEIGSSRCDLLFIDDSKKNQIRKSIGIGDKKLVLYAPTFRMAGDYELEFDPEELMKTLGDEYILGVKLHYLNNIKTKKLASYINLTDYNSINELLAITDLLITDYSSLMFDYSVIGKNMILFQYDQEDYFEERGCMFDMEEYLDKEYIVKTAQQLYSAVNSIKENNISKFKNIFYPHEIGDTTKKIVESINLVPGVRKISEIIFLVNDLNQIGGVHNFVNQTAKIFKQRYNSKIIVIGINEFNRDNDKLHVFDSQYVDIKISAQSKFGACKQILANTTGQIIVTQFSAHKKFQDFMYGKNVSLMFHGDVKDIIDKKLYSWHLDQLNNQSIYNYKKLLFLSESNSNLIKENLTDTVKNRVTFVENTYEFTNENLYKKSDVFVAVTRLDSDKNIFDIIELFNNKKMNPNYIIHVYGDGPLLNEFKYKIDELGLNKKIILKGYSLDKREIYNNKQGLINISLTEGMPLTMLEAINYSIPIYAYDSFTAAKDIVNDSNGRLIESQNLDKFVEVLNNKDEFCDVFESSKQYSNQEVLKKWDNFFNENNALESIEKSTNSSSINVKTKMSSYVFKCYRKLSIKNKVLVRKIYVKLKLSKIKLKNKPLISIIVPFYNNNDVIENCLKSLNNQEYSNIEILLINDGSDFTRDDLLKEYPKVRYIKKENEGLGKTRNLGIKEANGEYLFFLDSDDTIEYGALTLLMHCIQTNNVFIASGKTSRIKFEDPSDRHVWFYNIYKTGYVNQKQERHKLYSDTLSTNKLYNRKKLLESGILFEPGLYEDKLFINKIYKYYDEIGIISDFVYNWYIYGEKTSITTTLSIHNFDERLKRIYEIWDFSDEKTRSSNYHFAVNHDFKIYLNYFNTYTIEEKNYLYKQMSAYLINNKSYYYPSLITNIFNVAYLKAIFEQDFERFDRLCTLNSNVEKTNREKND